MWVVEHPDVVEVVEVRIYVKSGWMKRFCDFSLPAFLDNNGSITNFVGFPIPLVALSAHIE